MNMDPLITAGIAIAFRQESVSWHGAGAHFGANPLAESRSKLEKFMSEAVICDAIRTPFGRYGGSWPGVRTDDLAAMPIRALMERNPRRRLAGGGRRNLRLRESGRRGQSQRRAHGIAAGRPSAGRPRYHCESTLRLQHGRGWDCGPRHQVRRSAS